MHAQVKFNCAIVWMALIAVIKQVHEPFKRQSTWCIFQWIQFEKYSYNPTYTMAVLGNTSSVELQCWHLVTVCQCQWQHCNGLHPALQQSTFWHRSSMERITWNWLGLSGMFIFTWLGRPISVYGCVCKSVQVLIGHNMILCSHAHALGAQECCLTAMLIIAMLISIHVWPLDTNVGAISVPI